MKKARVFRPMGGRGRDRSTFDPSGYAVPPGLPVGVPPAIVEFFTEYRRLLDTHGRDAADVYARARDVSIGTADNGDRLYSIKVGTHTTHVEELAGFMLSGRTTPLN